MENYQNVSGKYLEGDIWFSRATIKDILRHDIENIKSEDTKHYITEMIKRLGKITIGY